MGRCSLRCVAFRVKIQEEKSQYPKWSNTTHFCHVFRPIPRYDTPSPRQKRRHPQSGPRGWLKKGWGARSYTSYTVQQGRKRKSGGSPELATIGANKTPAAIRLTGKEETQKFSQFADESQCWQETWHHPATRLRSSLFQETSR